MTYIGLGINDSPTIVMEAAEELKDARCLAVKFNEEGKGTLCGAGENAIGLLLAETDEVIPAGDDMHVQIKDMGRWIAAATVKPGDELTADADGKAVKAAAGDFITAIAITEAKEAGDIVQVQIVKAGYAAGATGSSGTTEEATEGNGE